MWWFSKANANSNFCFLLMQITRNWKEKLESVASWSILISVGAFHCFVQYLSVWKIWGKWKLTNTKSSSEIKCKYLQAGLFITWCSLQILVWDAIIWWITSSSGTVFPSLSHCSAIMSSLCQVFGGFEQCMGGAVSRIVRDFWRPAEEFHLTVSVTPWDRPMSIMSTDFSEMLILYCILCLRFCPSEMKICSFYFHCCFLTM